MDFPEIPGYKIEREIGSGGMATVFLALQESLHRKVALKVMVPGLSADETACHRFLKEGRIAAQLSHPHLLTVYDIGVHDDQYYMASEFLPGGTVRDKMKEGMSEEEIVRIITQIAEGLDYYHSKGFVHRDVKPGNLLFRGNEDCVLGDFGIAKSVDSNTNATKIGTSIGTPHYMSPEQAKGEKVDHRTDLYSLGIVFYEMLVGKPPFDADDPFSVALMQINQPVPDLPEKSKRFQPLIEKLMAKNRDERYEKAGSFIADLVKLAGGAAATAGGKSTSADPSAKAAKEPPPPEKRAASSRPPKAAKSPPVQRDRSGNRSVWPWVALLLVILAAGAGGWFWYDRQSGTDVPETVEQQPDPAPQGAGGEPDQEASRIETLLVEARDHVEAGRFFSPADGNAYASYQQVLRLEITNDEARDGLRNLVDEVEETAERLLEEGNRSEADRLLRDALRRFPADPRLRQLLSQAERAGSEQEGTATDAPAAASGDLEKTLVRAKRFYDSAQYTDATKLYRQVLAADPENQVARNQLEQIANNWAIAAQNFLQQGELGTAAGMIEKGLEAQPDHPRLLALRDRLERMQAEQGDDG